MEGDGRPVGQAEQLEFLDLAGSRDFLTADSVEALLAPMLAAGSSVSRVGMQIHKWMGTAQYKGGHKQAIDAVYWVLL